jgi:nucleoside-diphosphate-sugar epimerase
MKVAVTGATGFIGRHVVHELERRALATTLVLRPGSVYSTAVDKHTEVRFDLHDPPPNSYELLGHPDVLIHLAWDRLPNYRSLYHFEHELPAQYRFLSGLIRSGLKSLVVTGTCLEYGIQFGSLSEELEPCPTTPYGFAKDALRRQIEYLRQEQPVSLTWTRLFYVFGEGQAATSLLPQLQRAVKQRDKVFNMSGGEQLRDYLPVGEVAKYIVSLAVAGKVDNGIVNICSGKPISIRRLVEGWIEQNGWSIGLNLGHYPYPDYEPMAFWGDRQKLDRCLESQ